MTNIKFSNRIVANIILIIMTLKEKVQTDLIAAMKSGNETKKSTLRMLKAAIMKWEINGDEKQEADDDVVMQLIGKEIKQRKDAMEAFKVGGNNQMAEQEELERKILMEYMPIQMSEEEINVEVQNILSASGISSKADMGKAMGLVIGKLKNKANGETINKAVKAYLS